MNEKYEILYVIIFIITSILPTLMEDKRIIHVKDVVEAGLLINKYFDKHFPVPLRGAIASLNDNIELHYQSDADLNSITFKSINQILKDGSELNIDSNDGWTRVDYYPNKNNWAFVYAHDRSKINYCTNRTIISNKKIKSLKPIILVYNSSLLTKPAEINNIYNVKLPQNLEERSKAILAVFINHTEYNGDTSELPF